MATDRAFYGIWTLPPLRFLYYNIVQSLAVFYGRNDWHYYLSQGLPLLLTTALPFAIVGLVTALRPSSAAATCDPRGAIIGGTRRQLAATVVAVVLALSLVSHKKVRFIYPLLPVLHVLAADSVASFAWPILPGNKVRSPSQVRVSRVAWLVGTLLVNVAIALYTSRVHQSGVILSLDYIRNRHEAAVASNKSIQRTTVGFLMPCHSTPWRSHLVHAGIGAWALGCEPPVDLGPRGAGSLCGRGRPFLRRSGRLRPRGAGWLRGQVSISFRRGVSGLSGLLRAARAHHARDRRAAAGREARHGARGRAPRLPRVLARFQQPPAR